MPYVICDNCGGYYELQKGESPEDFEACNCGGNLRYAKSIRKEITKPKNTVKCRICGHEQEKGLVCSNCGSSIRRQISHHNRYDYRHVLNENAGKSFFERIEWDGVTSGIIFYIAAYILIRIVSVIFLGGSILAIQNGNTSTLFSVIGGVSLIFGLISALIPIASGFWTVSKITTRDYINGIINGGMVGVIIGIFIGILSLIFGLLMSGFYGQINIGITIMSGLAALIIGIIYGGIITAAGGFIAVYVRRHTSYI